MGSGFSASPTMLCRVGVAEVDPSPYPTPTPNSTPNPNPDPHPNPDSNPDSNPNQVVASLADDGRVRCLAPPLQLAAALSSDRISLTASAASPYLGGTAAVRGGVLALTNLTRNSAGSFRLAPRLLPPPHAADAPPAIRVSFAVRVWGGGGVSSTGGSWSHGDGFSLSYGQVCACAWRVQHVHGICICMACAWREHGICMACAYASWLLDSRTLS